MAINVFKESIAVHNSVVLKGVTGLQASGGMNEHIFQGELDAHNVANLSANQSLGFQTTDLKGIIGICGLDGALLTSGSSLVNYWRKKAHGGTFAAAGTDVSTTVVDGMIACGNLSASHGAPASVSVSVFPSSADGATEPIALSYAATTPAEVTVQDYAYTIAACKFGTLGAETVALQSIEYDFGLNIVSEGADGALYPNIVHVVARNPTISFTTLDIGRAADINFHGNQSVTAEPLVLFFARLKEGGGRYPDNETEHIKITINKYKIMADSLSDSGSIRILPLWDGTNDICVFDTGSVIS